MRRLLGGLILNRRNTDEVSTLRSAAFWKWSLAFAAVWVIAAAMVAGGVRLVAADSATEIQQLQCGSELSSMSGARLSTRSVSVVLALDDEWHDRFGADAQDVARALVSDVSGLYRDIGLHLLPVRSVRWDSPNTLDDAEELLTHLLDEVSLGDADVIIGLTGQQLPSVDGYARIGGQGAVVGHHPGLPHRDVFVLAHEVGHLFGAHHGCDIPGLAGVMADAGFSDPLIVCPCTRSILEENVARFHQEQPASQ